MIRNFLRKYTLVIGAGIGLRFGTTKLLANKGWNIYTTIISSQSVEEL